MHAVSFPAWKNGPIVVANESQEPLVPLFFWLKGHIYAITGSLLARNTSIATMAEGLGVSSLRAAMKPREIGWLQSQIDGPAIRRLFEQAAKPAPAPTPPRPLSAEEQAVLEARQKRQAEEQAAKAAAQAEEARFLGFVQEFQPKPLPHRDPRVPEAAKHAKRLVLIEFPDRKGKTALVVGSTTGQFWPAVPDHEAGMGALARNRWATGELANRYAGFRGDC